MWSRAARRSAERARCVALAAAAVAGMLAAGCASNPAGEARYRPAESVLEVVGRAHRFIENAPLATLDQPGLHELIDKLQLHINNVHNMIAENYFPSGEVTGVQRMATQRQTQRQATLSFGEASGQSQRQGALSAKD